MIKQQLNLISGENNLFYYADRDDDRRSARDILDARDRRVIRMCENRVSNVCEVRSAVTATRYIKRAEKETNKLRSLAVNRSASRKPEARRLADRVF